MVDGGCIDACPAGALKGNAWYPGLPREEILDVSVCDQWKRTINFSITRVITAEFARQFVRMD